MSDRWPHEAANAVLISKYMKSAITASGQWDTGQSVRSGAVTKARLAGADLALVLRAGDWSQVSTFKKFYFKPEDGFAVAVLK